MSARNCQARFASLLFLAAAALLLAVSCTSIATRVYELETPLLAEESRVTLVLLSDLHSTIHGGDQGPLIKKIRERRPDLILLSGDIVDDVVPVTGVELLLAGVQDAAPLFYVTGNHEFASRDIEGIRRGLESYGVTILGDRYVRVRVRENELILAGVEDPVKTRYEDPAYDPDAAMDRAFAGLGSLPLYKVLIAHRPERIDLYGRYGFDLVVSGHAHGGQVRLPFINGLYAPNQGVFPKYAGGMYVHGGMVHIVSRGLSINPRLPRIFNPPELVVIILRPPAQPGP
ncbi:MAG: metallophosphoesterase [Treponema sp.]|jgi:predicted MPP superfamily phosphohydrolase|nr:metallophosphoesterase [Treponema sp.]